MNDSYRNSVARTTAKTIKQTVMITTEEREVSEVVIDAIGKLGWQDDDSERVFCRGGVLVSALPTDDPDAPEGSLRIVTLPGSIIRERITDSVCLVVERTSPKGQITTVKVTPPKWMVDAIRERGHWNGKIKPLAGIIQAPTIRPDGSILQDPGYDMATGLMYSPLGEFPKVPDQPTRQNAIDATDRLLQIVKDFPFLDGADRSVWLAMALTMIARPAITGCCPLFAITGNIRGSGKTLLANAAANIAYGSEIAVHNFPGQPDELKKMVTTIALEGTAAVLWDNIAGKLGGAALDAALTSRVWNDRLLGQSKSTGDLPLKTVWIATGNNLQFGSDLARRVVPIRLESPLENPEERTGFEHPDLLGFIRKHRPQLAVDALTIIRAYFVANRPVQPGGQFGSFESWSAIIRGAVVWCGLVDPLLTRETAKAQDDSNELLGLLIEGLREADPDGRGLTVKEIENLSGHKPDETNHYPALHEAIGLVCGPKYDARRVGGVLRKYSGRIYRNAKITSKMGRSNLKRWSVELVSQVSLVSQNPSLRVNEKTILSKLEGAESGLPTVTTVTTQRTCSCGVVMYAIPAGSGWINWECKPCEYFEMEKLVSQ